MTHHQLIAPVGNDVIIDSMASLVLTDGSVTNHSKRHLLKVGVGVDGSVIGVVMSNMQAGAREMTEKEYLPVFTGAYGTGRHFFIFISRPGSTPGKHICTKEDYMAPVLMAGGLKRFGVENDIYAPERIRNPQYMPYLEAMEQVTDSALQQMPTKERMKLMKSRTAFIYADSLGRIRFV